MLTNSYIWTLIFRTNFSTKYVITDIMKYLIFCRLKGLSSAIVLHILRHITRNFLIDTAISHKNAQATQPYSLANQGPGCLFDRDEIPTGRIVKLIKMSFPVIIM